MKPTAFSVAGCLAGVGALWARPVAAEFDGFVAEFDFGAPPGVFSVIVHASFTDPNDRVIAVGGTTQAPITAWTADAVGTFYQDPQGAPATAPFLEQLPGVSGILEYDTFLTVGTLTDSLFQSSDDVLTTPRLGLGFGDTILGDDDLDGDGVPDGWNSVWFVIPGNPLGVPGQFLRVPIGRFSSVDGGVPRGMILLQYESAGQVRRAYRGFCVTIGLPCFSGDTNFDNVVDVIDLLNVLGCWGRDPDDCGFVDLDDNGEVGVGDLLIVLGNWTPAVDQPVAVDADLDDDGDTDVVDLLTLLGCWGPVEPGCDAADFNGDGRVGSTDLLDLLANWSES